jgi:hypothetical protein
MIPQTFPSVLVNNKTVMLVGVITNPTGLVRWVDYIPVKNVAVQTQVENTYSDDGYIITSVVSDLTGKQAWLDYIPIYDDVLASVPWSTDINGFIPVSDDGSIGTLVDVNYLDIKDISATPLYTWYAYNSVDSGNNLGIDFV